jgi:hypothetical protein
MNSTVLAGDGSGDHVMLVARSCDARAEVGARIRPASTERQIRALSGMLPRARLCAALVLLIILSPG